MNKIFQNNKVKNQNKKNPLNNKDSIKFSAITKIIIDSPKHSIKFKMKINKPKKIPEKNSLKLQPI
jgi:hypothetical protein